MKVSEMTRGSPRDDCQQQELISSGIGGKRKILKRMVCGMLVFKWQCVKPKPLWSDPCWL